MQQRDDVEIVVVDDASTDETQSISEQYSDDVVYIKNDRNLGHAATWGIAMSVAKGEYVVNLDADDWLLPDYFKRADQAANLNVGVIVNSVYDFRMSDGCLYSRRVSSSDMLLNEMEFRERLLSSIFFRTPGMAIRRDLVCAALPTDPRIYNGDWEFMLRASRGAAAFLIADPVAVYRVHPSSMSSFARANTDRLRQNCLDFLAVTRDPAERAYLEPSERTRFAAGVAQFYLRTVSSQLRFDDFRNMSHHVTFALSLAAAETPKAVVATGAFLVRGAIEKAFRAILPQRAAYMSVADALPARRHAG